MTELVIDARVLVYNVTVGGTGFPEVAALDQRLKGATTLLAPSCEFLRSHRMLRTLGAAGFLTPADVVGMSMMVCESGVELRPLWPWDIPRVSALACHPSDAWCVALAESVGVPFVTRNAQLSAIGAVCPIEVY